MNWEKALDMMPLEKPYCESIFRHMLVACKVTKFWQINYKILSRILATPKVISAVQGAENLQWCIWCGALGTLEHILLACPKTKELHNHICSHEILRNKNTFAQGIGFLGPNLHI